MPRTAFFALACNGHAVRREAGCRHHNRDLEAYRHHRREQRRSAVTINLDLKQLRKMAAWDICELLLTPTPFKVVGEGVIRFDPESPREKRLTSKEAERPAFRDALRPIGRRADLRMA
jgi:hypothetical protein